METNGIKILVGCEESQAVTIEFRKLGFEAYSCDLLPCSGGHPEWHIQADIFEVLQSIVFYTSDNKRHQINQWNAGIFFPTCTYLTVSANKWYKDQPERKSGSLVGQARRDARESAIDFVINLYECGIESIGIENPIGVLSSRFRKPDQVLQPWMFGHGETKATCLWLKNFPKLTPTNIVEGREQKLHYLPPSKDRAMLRSKTFPGIAKAMATQWGEFLLSGNPAQEAEQQQLLFNL